jgi:hypothetical protein
VCHRAILRGMDVAADPAPARVEAARRLLERDGSAFVLRPWQAGYLLTLADGRDPGPVPVACGLGAGWLEARLAEAIREADPG